MAWTHIKAIRFNISNTINYTKNQEKTALSNAVDYAFNHDKTEQHVFETVMQCGQDTAYYEMMRTKERFKKRDGVQGYHLVQSFRPGEVTPTLCHEIGKEFVRRLLDEGYQVVISTHLNTKHLHNHIVWNSVNAITGKKYHINERELHQLVRRISDDLCREHGLSVIAPKGKAKHYAEYQAERNGQPTQRSVLRESIDKGILHEDVFSLPSLYRYLELQGYHIMSNPRYKYVTARAPGAKHAIRISEKLGEGYSIEDILERIETKPPPTRKRELDYDIPPSGCYRSPRKQNYYRPSVFDYTTLRAAFSLKGFRWLYFDYLRRMGRLRKRPRLTVEEKHALKADIAKLDKRIRIMDYLNKTGYSTRTEIEGRIAILTEKANELTKERHPLYADPNGKDRIQAINNQLKPIRKEITICRDVISHAEDIQRQIRDIRLAEEGRRVRNNIKNKEEIR